MANAKQTREKEVASHPWETAEVETSAAFHMNSTRHSSGQDQLASRRSSRRWLGLRLHSEPAFLQQVPAVVSAHRQERRQVPSEPEERPCPPGHVLLPTPEVSSSAEKVLLDPEINASQ